MDFMAKIRKHGLAGVLRIVARKSLNHIRHHFDAWRFRDAPHYANPNSDELAQIERDLARIGINVIDYAPSLDRFFQFQSQVWFPDNYHGGKSSGVWDEKFLEHWIAGELLDLVNWTEEDIYVDVAACGSPWAKMLRDRLGLSAFAIDLEPVADLYRDLPYYRTENATHTTFKEASVFGASLQCAYEMFMGNDDQLLIWELARILRPGGKVVILPLYMHTHYCAYATPEYFGKGYSDPCAKEYIRMDCYGVPSSRKYDAKQFKARVLDQVKKAGLQYRVLALRNKEAFGQHIYCHFILEIEK